MSRTAIVRSDKSGGNFSQILHLVWEDPALDLASCGLLGWMLSHRDGWNFHGIEGVAKSRKITENVARRLIKRLENAGYLKRLKGHHPKGHEKAGTKWTTWTLFDTPQAHLRTAEEHPAFAQVGATVVFHPAVSHPAVNSRAYQDSSPIGDERGARAPEATPACEPPAAFDEETVPGAMCALLGELIEGNGSARPDTRGWEQGMVLLLASRDSDEVAEVIRWSQQDSHWRAVVMSVDKLTEHYDKLRLRWLNGQTQPVKRDRPSKKKKQTPHSAALEQEQLYGAEADRRNPNALTTSHWTGLLSASTSREVDLAWWRFERAPLLQQVRDGAAAPEPHLRLVEGGYF